MRQSDRGASNAKLIFVLLFLAALAYASFKIIPIYVGNYELNDDIRQLAIQATVDRSSAEAVQNRVLDYAKDLGLPVTRENVSVHVGQKVTIEVDYRVPIDLKVFSFDMHFTPSAENKQL